MMMISGPCVLDNLCLLAHPVSCQIFYVLRSRTHAFAVYKIINCTCMCFIFCLHNSQQFVQVFTERINPGQIHSQHPLAGYTRVGRHFNVPNHSISVMILQGFMTTIQPHGLNYPRRKCLIIFCLYFLLFITDSPLQSASFTNQLLFSHCIFGLR